MPNLSLTIFASIFPVICLIFNGILLAAILVNRKNNTLPLAYITVMSTNGMIISLFVSLHVLIYLVLSEETYAVYLVKFGRETTLGGTFAYLFYLLVSVLMTINRVVVVAKPFNEIFTHTRVFIYCGIIAILMFISLFIPYLSSCYIVFNVNKLAFVSGCAPGRHPITLFQNTYAIILPFSCMFVNLGIIAHLKCVRNGIYKKVLMCVTGKKPTNEERRSSTLQSTSMSKIQARRDKIMMKQTIVVAIYLSIYEMGAFIVKLFPDAYMSLPPIARECYFYFRLESIPLMNFIIYYVETGSTRRMLRRFLNLKVENNDSVFNATAVAPAPQTITAQTRSRSCTPVN